MVPLPPASFRRTAAALLLLVAAAGCDRLEPALQAHVTVASGVKASCVQVSVYTSSDVSGVPAEPPALVKRPAGKDEFFVAIYKGSLPGQVWVTARPMFGVECQDPLVPNGAAVVASGTFPPPKGLTTVDLAIALPTAAEDGDGDGFVGAPSGADCNDGNGAVNPGAAEHCLEAGDFNCDTKIGCADPTCPASACLATPTQLAFVSTPKTLAAGACSATPVMVETRDGSGAALAAVVSTPVAFNAPDGNLSVFSDSACQSLLSAVTISPGASRASAYISGTLSGSFRLAASAPGLGTVEQTETIQPGPQTQLVFTSAAQATLPLNGCSEPATVQFRDTFGNASPPGPINLALTSDASPSSSFKFYSDSTCSTLITQTPVAAGASSATFYFKSSAAAAGTVNVTVTGGGRTAMQAVGLVFRTPSQLAFTTGPFSVPVNVCSPAVTLQTQDALNQPAPVLAATNIPLSASAGTLTFYSSSTCATAITQVTIGASLSSTSFFFRSTAQGTPIITANGGTALGSPTQMETITAPVPTLLAFATAAQAGVVANQCSAPVDIESRDGSGTAIPVGTATQVDLATNPSGQVSLYLGGTCGGSAINAATLASGNSRVTISFKGTVAGSTTITASTAGNVLTSAQQIEGVVPAAAAKIIIQASSKGQTLAAGACGAITIELQDSFGNTVTAASNQTVNLTSTTSPTGITFYSASDCSGGTTTTARIDASTSQKTFYFKGTTPGSFNIAETPQSGSLTGDSAPVTITSGAPTTINFSSAPQTAVVAGVCSAPVVLTTYDAQSNVAPVMGNTTVTLGSTGLTGVTFYAGAGCTGTALTSVTIPNNSSSVTYSFKTNTAASGTLTASAGALGAPTQAVTVIPAAPSQLLFTLGPLTVPAGSCSGTVGPLAIQTRDTFGNVAPVAVNTDVALAATNSASSAPITFHTASTCSGGVTTVRINAGASSTPSFYFKTNGAGTWVVTGSFGSLTPATQNETVTAGAPSALAYTSVEQTVAPGNCSARVTFELQDTFGNLSPPTAQTTVNLTPSGDAFYRNSSCAGSQVIAGNIITLSIGAVEGQYWFKAPASPTTYTIGITSTGLTSASQDETIQ